MSEMTSNNTPQPLRVIARNTVLSTPAKSAALLLALLALGGAGAALAGSNAMFCCADQNGKQVCGDLLPQACFGRAYREIGESGRTVRQVEAPLNAEQRAQRAIEEERRAQEEAARKEQQRKDQALLNTYGSEKDIEIMRLRAEADVRKSITAAESKIEAARQQRKKFENEAEFYKKKKMPASVEKGLLDADAEIKAQESVIAAKNKEMSIVRAKYDEDLKRFQALSKRGVRPE